MSGSRNGWRAGSGAVLVVLVLVLGGFAALQGGAPARVQGAQGEAQALLNATHYQAPASTPLGGLEAAFQPYLAQVPASVQSSIVHAVVAQAGGSPHAIQDLAQSWGVSFSPRPFGGGTYFDIVGSLAVTAAILGIGCGVLTGATMGISCIATLAVLVILLAYVYLFAPSAANALSTAATSLANLMLNFLRNTGFDDQAITFYDQLQQWNATYGLDGYEAAAAALLQLGNGTFNGPLDIVQSNLSDQFDAFLGGDYSLLTQQYTTTANTFNIEEGSENTGGFYCSLEDTATSLNSVSSTGIAFPAPASGACAHASPGSFNYDQGTMNTTQDFGLTASIAGAPAIYFNPANTFWLRNTGATFTNVSLLPVSDLNAANRGALVTTLTFGAVHQEAQAFNGLGYGGYYLWSYSGATDAFIQFAMGLNAQADTTGPIALFIPNATSTDLSVGGLYALGGDPCVGVSSNCASLVGSGSPVGAAPQEDGEVYLFHLEQVAETVGQTYWTYLRTIGYTSPSEVPASCLILNPGNVLPPTVTLASLEALNVTSLLAVYQSTMLAIAGTFNASTALNAYNFCGKHVVTPIQDSVIPFGTYAFGWVYNPNAMGNASGLGTQHFGTPDTWNYSGIVYLSPVLASTLDVTLNTTWLLPSQSETVVLVQPLTNGSAGTTQPIRVNAQAPTQCLTYNASGCNTTGRNLVAVGWTLGNSTLLNGSAYPGHISASASGRWAVYLTACFQAVPGSPITDPTYQVHQTTCSFARQTIGTFIGNQSCDYTVSLSCGGNSGGAVLIGGACGSGYLGFLNDLAAPFAGIPVVGPFSCAIAYLLFGVIVVVVLYVAIVAVRSATRRSGGGA